MGQRGSVSVRAAATVAGGRGGLDGIRLWYEKSCCCGRRRRFIACFSFPSKKWEPVAPKGVARCSCLHAARVNVDKLRRKHGSICVQVSCRAGSVPLLRTQMALRDLLKALERTARSGEAVLLFSLAASGAKQHAFTALLCNGLRVIGGGTPHVGQPPQREDRVVHATPHQQEDGVARQVSSGLSGHAEGEEPDLAEAEGSPAAGTHHARQGEGDIEGTGVSLDSRREAGPDHQGEAGLPEGRKCARQEEEGPARKGAHQGKAGPPEIRKRTRQRKGGSGAVDASLYSRAETGPSVCRQRARQGEGQPSRGVARLRTEQQQQQPLDVARTQKGARGRVARVWQHFRRNTEKVVCVAFLVLTLYNAWVTYHTHRGVQAHSL